MEETDDFLEEVEEERINQGIGRIAFSKKAFGVETYYNRYYVGEKILTIEAMKQMADALGMKLVCCIVEK